MGFSFFGKILHLTCREKNLKCTRCKFKISKTLNPLWHALEHIARVIFTYFDRSFARKKKKRVREKNHKVSFYISVIYSAKILGELYIFFFLFSLSLGVSVSVRSCVSDLWDACRLLPREARCTHPTQTGSQNNDSAACVEFTSN